MMIKRILEHSSIFIVMNIVIVIFGIYSYLQLKIQLLPNLPVSNIYISIIQFSDLFSGNCIFDFIRRSPFRRQSHGKMFWRKTSSKMTDLNLIESCEQLQCWIRFWSTCNKNKTIHILHEKDKRSVFGVNTIMLTSGKYHNSK